MKSTLRGRLKNTDLPFSRGLMPLFEGVVNSIQSVEDRSIAEGKAIQKYKVDVEIIRDNQISLLDGEEQAHHGITGFRIVDDGAGFDDGNWASFNELDSLHKEEKGCRGVGRLLWLKAFDSVAIDSVYTQDGEIRRRKFTFDEKSEVTTPKRQVVGVPAVQTVVELIGFKKRYAANTNKSAEHIAIGLLEHCLWYFVRKESVPSITVIDGDNRFDLFDLYDSYMHTSASSETFSIKGWPFEMTHVKIRAAKKQNHSLGLCAASRLVKEESLTGRVPGLFSAISDAAGDFVYMAYLTSPYLDEKVTNERTAFNMEEHVDGLHADVTISYDDIRQVVVPKIESFLADSLEANIKAGREKLNKFVSEVAPKYRPMLGHMDVARLNIDPATSDKDLDILLHREVFKVEQEMLSLGHDIMTPKPSESEADYGKRLESYLQKAADLKQSDLVNYVMHRRIVIDLLSVAVEQKNDGKFSREDLIHELIVPMRTTSDDFEFRRQNLWLVDERLAFHHYLASDKPLATNPTTSDTSGKEPDVASLRIFDNPLLVGEQKHPQASITVVEIKRPMRKDFQAGESEEKDPILQSLGYLKRLRRGAATRDGRPIPNAEKIPGFIYIVADFTNHLQDCCKLHQLQKTSDGMGYFGYHRDEAFNAYIQVVSFDGLVASATERNRAFFDQLGLPAK